MSPSTTLPCCSAMLPHAVLPFYLRTRTEAVQVGRLTNSSACSSSGGRWSPFTRAQKLAASPELSTQEQCCQGKRNARDGQKNCVPQSPEVHDALPVLGKHGRSGDPHLRLRSEMQHNLFSEDRAEKINVALPCRQDLRGCARTFEALIPEISKKFEAKPARCWDY